MIIVSMCETIEKKLLFIQNVSNILANDGTIALANLAQSLPVTSLRALNDLS